MKKVLKYKRGTDFLNKVFAEYPKGKLMVICPHCKEEMLVILDHEDVIEHQRSEGLYCPNGHIQAVCNIKRSE